VADGTPTVTVVGAAGYAGAIAAALLYRHPGFELRHVTARADAGQRLDDVHPRARVPLALEVFDIDAHGDVDAAVVCYPHGAAAPTVAALRERGVRVVDLSADFRLRDRAIYEDWYQPHGAPELFGGGIYGLPELHRNDVRDADLVANPGCYPTAALLALAPLARAGLIGDLVVDAKSGVSGAGRDPKADLQFGEVNESVKAYGIFTHRHIGEIEQELGALGGHGANPGVHGVDFLPHLIPMTRGILSACHVRPTRPVSQPELDELYREAYGDEAFVSMVETAPATKHVLGSNEARVWCRLDERNGRILAIGVLDNLVKGAAGQGIQAFNVVHGLPETAGLLQLPLGP
jgi:N-acetyl-gamma-glutamyl-phosphate reductase